MSTAYNPRILGVAGGGLRNAQWAANAAVAKIGQSGEQQTAATLERFAAPDNGVTVLHDLHIPIPNFNANIDHVVVSGSSIHIIDTKVWKPARYWTIAGMSFRGFKRFEPAEKKTMAMAVDALERYLNKKNVRASIEVPVVAISPSSTRKKLKVGLLSIPGARAMTWRQFVRYADKTFTPAGRIGRGAKPADPAVVNELAHLLVTKPAYLRETGTGW